MLSKTFGALCAGSFSLAIAVAAPATAQGEGSSGKFVAHAPVLDQPGRREWVWEGGDSLTVAGPGKVRYEASGSPRIIVTGDPEAVASIEVGGGVIRKRDSFFRGEKNQNLNILVQGVILNHVDLMGSAAVNLGSLQRDQLVFHISGSGTISAQGQTNGLTVDVSGSGHANLNSLSVNDVNITVNGSGRVNTGGIAGHADVKVNGSGSATVGSVANGAAVKVTGSGNVYLGPTQTVDATVAGAGSVRLNSVPVHSTFHVTGAGAVLLVASDGKTTQLAQMGHGRSKGRSEVSGVEAPRASQ